MQAYRSCSSPILMVLGRECGVIPLQNKCVKAEYPLFTQECSCLTNHWTGQFSLTGILLQAIWLGEGVDEAFYRQLEVLSWSQAFTTFFNHSGIFWKDNTAGHTVQESPAEQWWLVFDTSSGAASAERCGAAPCANEERRTDLGCEGWGILGCSDHDMVKFKNLYGGNRAKSRVPALAFRRAKSGLFKDLLGGIPWVSGLEGMGWIQVVEVQTLLLQRWPGDWGIS